MIRAGADLKTVNRYGVAPISLACARGNADIVELLLQAGADANTALPEGETCLMTAAGAGILMVSSELPELLGMSDRILVMHQGRVQALFDARDATQESVLHAALGLAS